MPKKFKGENSKVTAAKEKKAAVQADKDSKQRAVKEQKEAAEWAAGAKKSREDEERKKAERLARKAEAAALLAQEEAALGRGGKNASPTPSGKKAKGVGVSELPFAVPAPRSAAKKAAEKTAVVVTFTAEPVPEYSASGIDAALELLDIATTADAVQTKTVRKEDAIDRHPERRAKAAWLAYKERETPKIKAENPGLRLSQIEQMLWKQWQKSPENPFNQATVAYNATAEDERQAISERKEAALERMRTK
ncbi:hypothetical protein AMAG_08915 [Allomyces macrogynus ATCC 38327]|uniref:HMG box domain-containing protein n=1 Tax=Allomyces macrogynus (strain ATCC 38327) TaxID=578462 RepID=A0A0L0SMR9_ALLM3|nr:hypothetical protein AMAG_08915 [Allomyces macrogynus ATCC 38327]|eukprot:KNE63851.1 hypothetical protein AMAG_08915 [Allomyces macrogynus ATCC 38327]